jgi:hypothetical protein
MKHEIAKKLLAGHRGVATEPNFTDQLPAMRRQLGVNRKSMPLLAMKYAIGETIFLSVRFGLNLCSHAFKPGSTAEGLSEVSHEMRNWEKLFSRSSRTCARVVGGERAFASRPFLGPF